MPSLGPPQSRPAPARPGLLPELCPPPAPVDAAQAAAVHVGGPVILLDPATARDVLAALALLEGRRRVAGAGLSKGTIELRAVAEASLRSLTVGLSPHGAGMPDSGEVDPHLLTLEDCKARLAVGLTTVKAAIRNGQLRAVHLGRAVRVHSDDLAEYMDRLRKDAAA